MSGRRGWLLLLLAALAWSAQGSGALASGWSSGGVAVAGRFAAAALRPDLSPAFLAEVAAAAVLTCAYAVLGTALAVAAGVVLGVLCSQTWWSREGRVPGATPGWLAARGALALPRALHEAVWALLLVVLLGPTPVAGVLAIAVPYAAVTAKVVADLLDEADPAPYRALRAAGAARLPAVATALAPRAAGDVLSYAMVRLDCAVRGAVVLGVVGVGGLGLLLDAAFQDLAYERMWTCIGALLLLCAGSDVLSRRVRRSVGRDAGRSARRVLLVAVPASALAWAVLEVDLAPLTSRRVAEQASYLGAAAWPPALPAGGAGALASAAVETLQLSVLAALLAAAAAAVLAPVAARSSWTARDPLPVALAGSACRGLLLLLRAVPAPVWALLLLLLLRAGPLPGALALAAATLGVLGRLDAEVLEDLDPAPARALAVQGAGRSAVLAHAVLPRAVPRFAAYGLYRWEVALRETVVVGMVGAGGLGLLLVRQLAAFDLAGVAGTLLALVALTAAVDVAGAAARRSLR